MSVLSELEASEPSNTVLKLRNLSHRLQRPSHHKMIKRSVRSCSKLIILGKSSKYFSQVQSPEDLSGDIHLNRLLQ